MPRKMEVMSVYLLPAQAAGLRARAEASRLPVALLIRDAVDDYLEARDASGVLKLVRPSSPRRVSSRSRTGGK